MLWKATSPSHKLKWKFNYKNKHQLNHHLYSLFNSCQNDGVKKGINFISKWKGESCLNCCYTIRSIVKIGSVLIQCDSMTISTIPWTNLRTHEYFIVFKKILKYYPAIQKQKYFKYLKKVFTNNVATCPCACTRVYHSWKSFLFVD